MSKVKRPEPIGLSEKMSQKNPPTIPEKTAKFFSGSSKRLIRTTPIKIKFGKIFRKLK